jgi:hypothetical protein
MTRSEQMAESRGLEPLTLAGSLLSKQLPRPAGRSPCVVGEVGVEPTKYPRSERGAFANLTTRPIGPVGGSRTHTVQALDLLPLPVGLRPDNGPRRWSRTSTEQGLSLSPLPIGLGADGARRRSRTCTVAGLSRVLLPVERVSRYLAEGAGVEPACRLRRRFSGPGRYQFRYNPPHVTLYRRDRELSRNRDRNIVRAVYHEVVQAARSRTRVSQLKRMVLCRLSYACMVQAEGLEPSTAGGRNSALYPIELRLRNAKKRAVLRMAESNGQRLGSCA